MNRMETGKFKNPPTILFILHNIPSEAGKNKVSKARKSKKFQKKQKNFREFG